MTLDAEVKSGIIQSGQDKGRIADPDVAHEMYNTISEQYILEGQAGGSKKDFFTRKKGGNRLMVAQAVKSVSHEKRNTDLEKQIIIDPLTGLYSRRYYFEELAKIEARMKRTGGIYSVVRGDMRRLKFFNDTYGGHHAGDKLLIGIAKGLRLATRITDIVARLHGDEFGVILPHVEPHASTMTPKDASVGVALRMLEAVHSQSVEFADADGNYHPHLDIGLAIANNGESAIEVDKMADKASNIAKRYPVGQNDAAIIVATLSDGHEKFELAQWENRENNEIKYTVLDNPEEIIARSLQR